MRPLIIDCDTGRDDALAIWLALSWKLPLAGVVATFGNVSQPHVIENCGRVLALAGRADIPLWAGIAQPSQDHETYQTKVLTRQATSGNGLCNLELPVATGEAPPPLIRAAEDIKAMAQAQGPVDYLITGPATSFAALCDIWGDETPLYINRVIMMGGKFDPLWDQMPGADFNIMADPFAVQRLLNSGLEVILVPMNATWPVAVSLADLEKESAATPLGQWALDLMIAHCRHFAPEPVFRFHDPCVIVAAGEGPENFQAVNISIQCGAGINFGRLRVVEDGTGYRAKLYVPVKTADVMKDEMLAALRQA